MQFQSGGHRQGGRKVGGACVHPRPNIGQRKVFVVHEAVYISQTRFGNVDKAHAQGRPNPFVQIEAHKVNAQRVDFEIDLAPRMSGI